MKKTLLMLGVLGAASLSAFGATACSANGTLQDLINFGETGCEVGDKVFSNFHYNPTGTDPAAGNVTIGLDKVPALLEYGLQFGSNANIWTSSFTLTYTITVDQTQCLVLFGSSSCKIVEAQGGMQGSTTPNSAALSMALSPGGTVSLDALSTQDEVKQIFFAPITSTNVTITGSGLGATSPISSFGLDVYQAVPEPMTLSMMGIGLLGLGLMRRRQMGKK